MIAKEQTSVIKLTKYARQLAKVIRIGYSEEKDGSRWRKRNAKNGRSEKEIFSKKAMILDWEGIYNFEKQPVKLPVILPF